MARPINIPNAPEEYDRRTFDQVFRTINAQFIQLSNPGDAVYNTLRLLNLPTSATGLPSGSVWNDTGTLKIVP